MGPALQSARFHTTVARQSQIPLAGLPEIAFAGRSNSGKSSAINKICQRKRLAFASKTPGRTQALNYFGLGPAGYEAQAFLVDTPGYGYASVPLAVKKDWQGLAGWYLRERKSLNGVVLMLDCRRLLTAMDADLLSWVPAHVPRLILITKADKLKKQAQRQTLNQIQDQYQQCQPDTAATFLLFSSVTGQGVEQARELIGEWLPDNLPLKLAPPPEPRPPKPKPEATEDSNPRRGGDSRKGNRTGGTPGGGSSRAGQAKKNPVNNAPGSKPVNRGARSGRRSGR
ncbi:MAG: ribosome biogenesis GTP-binding protein YihA/YsxC [Burkholderiaceae bacterium]